MSYRLTPWQEVMMGIASITLAACVVVIGVGLGWLVLYVVDSCKSNIGVRVLNRTVVITPEGQSMIGNRLNNRIPVIANPYKL